MFVRVDLLKIFGYEFIRLFMALSMMKKKWNEEKLQEPNAYTLVH